MFFQERRLWSELATTQITKGRIVGKRATRDRKRAAARNAEFDALKAENLQLKEELERLRLRRAGAHPGANFAEAMEAVDDAGDAADEAVTMYASSMVIRAELQSLLKMLASTISEFDQRLERLDHRAEFPLKALNELLSGQHLASLAELNGHTATDSNGHQDPDDETTLAELNGHDGAESNGHQDPDDHDADAGEGGHESSDEPAAAVDEAAADADDVAPEPVDDDGITIDLLETRDNTEIEDEAWADDAAEAAAAKGA